MLYTSKGESVSNFHYLSRGIVMVDGKVLVVKATGANNTFLPGGHIEIGEKAKDALEREINEEIGKHAVVKDLLGAVENAWGEGGMKNFEINLVFSVEIAGLTAEEPPTSQESHLQFIWLKPEELKDNNLKPAPIIDLIREIQ